MTDYTTKMLSLSIQHIASVYYIRLDPRLLPPLVSLHTLDAAHEQVMARHRRSGAMRFELTNRCSSSTPADEVLAVALTYTESKCGSGGHPSMLLEQIKLELGARQYVVYGVYL
jgi:hypothetical protein